MSIIEKGNEWARKNPIKFIIIGIFLFGLSIRIGSTFSGTSNPNSSKSNNNISGTDCNGYGDERFIRSKMDEMDRDVLEFSEIDKRKYYVRYISWSNGTAVNGDQILDYSNNPCND